MPVSALIPAAAQILSSGIGAVAQGSMNRKTRQFTKEMYGLQRKDALADYAMQNEYNSPAAQMKRLVAAGLNPNLAYGDVNNVSAPVRSSTPSSWNPKAYDYGSAGKDTILAYQDARIKTATLDNLEAQNKVLIQDAALKGVTAANTAMHTARGEFDLGLARDLRDTSLQTAQANLDRMTVGTDIMLKENERAAALNSSNLLEAATRILKMRAETANTEAEAVAIQKRIEGLGKDNRIKDLDINLKEKGIQPSDNMFMRILGQIMSNSIERLPKPRPDLSHPSNPDSWRNR